MENASKALIIAGAILIAILLISVGVIIMNSTGNMSGRVADSSETMAIQSFNSQFTPYEGNGKTATQVRSLVSLVKASRGGPTIAVTYSGKNGNNATLSAATLLNNDKYSITLGYEAEGEYKGYVNEVTINGPK